LNPSLDVLPSLYLSNRHDQIVLLQCRIGHTKITHSYLNTNDNAPFSVACNENFNVKHFLLEYLNFSQARFRFYRVNSLKELFNTIPSKNIIDYLKEINLYSRLLLTYYFIFLSFTKHYITFKDCYSIWHDIASYVLTYQTNKQTNKQTMSLFI
jgi:hypothetical protein